LLRQRGNGVIVTTGSPLLRILVLPDGRRIACAEYGDPSGLPVLALHGTPGSRLMFALADRAARDRGIRLIAPERPGYGLSDYRHAESLTQGAEDLSAVADTYELGRFAVIGVSGGGPYAVAAAAAMPDRISLSRRSAKLRTPSFVSPDFRGFCSGGLRAGRGRHGSSSASYVPCCSSRRTPPIGG
jgi:pimeloyl-ACP methyl ester carboxylesterase